MPVNCPLGLVPFFAPDACSLGCPRYDSEREVCHWFFPPRPIVEILDTEERRLRLERLYSELKRQSPKVGQPKPASTEPAPQQFKSKPIKKHKETIPL